MTKKTCERHFLEYDSTWECPQCQADEITKLRLDIKSWKEAWYHQRDCTGKSYWTVPPVRYMLGDAWSPPVFRDLLEARECTNLMASLLEGFITVIGMSKDGD